MTIGIFDKCYECYYSTLKNRILIIVHNFNAFSLMLYINEFQLYTLILETIYYSFKHKCSLETITICLRKYFGILFCQFLFVLELTVQAHIFDREQLCSSKYIKVVVLLYNVCSPKNCKALACNQIFRTFFKKEKQTNHPAAKLT